MEGRGGGEAQGVADQLKNVCMHAGRSRVQAARILRGRQLNRRIAFRLRQPQLRLR
jgi:hypothetical protein